MNRKIMRHAAALAFIAPGLVNAEIEMTGYLKNETGLLTNLKPFIGEAQTNLDTEGRHDAWYKFENSARLFLNDEFGEDWAWHADLNLMFDTAAISDYQGHEAYTQNDWLREFYVDTRLGDFDLRLGKQQVVWGTADGIKLLDIINPTDFRELRQNTMEDARIPVWMLNVERPVGDVGHAQFILAQHEENKIPGLNAAGDSGHPFILQGVDSITGRVNGFLHIAPALTRVAASFQNSAIAGGFDITGDGSGNAISTGLSGFGGLTVDGFAGSQQYVNANGTIVAPGVTPTSGTAALVSGAALLNNVAQNGINAAGDGNANRNVTNLLSGTWNPGSAASAFELMPNASFATFNTFAGSSGNDGFGFGGATTSFAGINAAYVRDYPDAIDPNWGFRYQAHLDSGLNFSLNYFHHYDPNPVVNIGWHDATTGERLTTVYAKPGDVDGNGVPDFADPTGAAGGGAATRGDIPTDLSTGASPISVLLRNDHTGSTQHGRYYGGVNPNPFTLTQADHRPQLRFTESLNRVNSFGAAFDYAFEAVDLPIVLRGEFLYDADVAVPVLDRLALSIGDLENALKSEKTNLFKYVLGVDVTVLTNLMVSAQFIQFIDTGYINDQQTCKTATGIAFDCSRYTGDAATLHLSNGVQKGEEYKEFFSLFLSKPFGNEQQHRLNNLTIFEDTGGIWNRFDIAYAFNDELIGTVEINLYGGDQNTTFGQFETSSNIQFGVQYLFD